MRNRLAFIAGLAIGFVLGARAGRERYEQLQKLARRAAEHPAVRNTADAVQAHATEYAKVARDKLMDRADMARSKVNGFRSSDANGHVYTDGDVDYDRPAGTPSEQQEP
ncbi:MAG TPA: hypothetical protein VGS19_22960 [Streptosporangiaceae bacterium]|nr:hypothetical protein [Streptosporangiaceae bacterium]